jgi:hypothetical protein
VRLLTRKPESIVTGSGVRSLLGFISTPPVFLRFGKGEHVVIFGSVSMIISLLKFFQVSNMVFISASASLCAGPIEHLHGYVASARKERFLFVHNSKRSTVAIFRLITLPTELINKCRPYTVMSFDASETNIQSGPLCSRTWPAAYL